MGKSKNKESERKLESSNFVDLTPNDNAEINNSYSEALEFAISSKRIKNIALTGPYGAGKSSIIQTFEAKNKDKYKFLNISLASFDDKKVDNETSSRLIERSILQQMLYGSDANNLPYSRFKRISTPTLSFPKSVLALLWLASAYFLYHHKSEFFNLNFVSWPWLKIIGSGLLSLFVFLGFSLILSKLYDASFKVSLKKISLKNAEIEAGDLSESSILNRHLDEIIYFFQVTDYNVVVIEDLDRFGDPEIFVKLREINKLVNDNAGTNGKIKFLYALKDDMFVHKHRAKFFDFIIPVIPVINSFNSLNKINDRLNELSLKKPINDQFLRRVAIFIDDLRLIHNIFNEFAIYHNCLESEGLDKTNLLAMMIYKNIYPSDFENLHHGKGVLFDICQKKSQYLQKRKDELQKQTKLLKVSLKKAEDESARTVQELINIYIGQIVKNTPHAISAIIINNQQITFKQITTYEQFKPLLSETNIQVFIQTHGSYQGQQFNLNKSFEDIEEEVNPGETFSSRKKNIEHSEKVQRAELSKNIRSNEKQISELPYKKLHELLQNDKLNLGEVFGKNSDGRLFIYLIKNGFLDDNYYLYTSNFYEGGMTKNDREFIITISNFEQPDANQQIDTPKEVCENMSEEDFGHKYVLNVHLIDYLLANSSENATRIEAAMLYISENYQQSEDFFTTYFTFGKHLENFIQTLCKTWPDFSKAAFFPFPSAEKISYILRFVDPKYIADEMNMDNILTDYLAESGDQVFVSDNIQSPDNFEVLKGLDVRFRSLPSLEQNELLLDYLHENSLYAITPENVNLMLLKYRKESSEKVMSFKTANYTSILTFGSDSLKEYIEGNLSDYIDRVFLILPDNMQEGESAIVTLLDSEKLNEDQKKAIVSKQGNVFETFEGLPAELWTHALQEEKIVISWENISLYLRSKGGKKDLITELIQKPDNVKILLTHKIAQTELDEESQIYLLGFIFRNDGIGDSEYCSLIMLFLYYHYDYFPSHVSRSKRQCLAQERMVRLAEQSFNDTSDDNELLALLIEKNFDEYQNNKEIYPIGDEICELLFQSDLDDQQKLLLCQDVTATGASDNLPLSRLILHVLLQDSANCEGIEPEVLKAVILNAESQNDKIKLLIKCIPLWDEATTMEALAELKKPYSDIASYSKCPKLEKNDLNSQLAELLESKSYISSQKEEGNRIRINTKRSK